MIASLFHRLVDRYLFKVRLLLFFVLLPVAAYPFTLIDAHRDYLRGNYEEAVYKTKNLPKNEETLYFLGLVYTKMGNYSKARVFLRKLIKQFPGTELSKQGKIKLANTYFLTENYSKAKKMFKDIEKRCRRLDNMSLVLLRLAQISSRQGEWEEKQKYLERVKGKYPSSSEMKFVDILESYGDFFTIQIGAFSQEKNALSLVGELGKGYQVCVVKDTKGSYPLYKVRVGKYKDRRNAQKASLKLINEGYPARIYP